MDKIKALLERLDLQDKIIEEYCQIEAVEVDKIKDTWTFFLVFERVIPIMYFRNFMQKLLNLPTIYTSLKMVDYQIKFLDLDGEILDYYDFAIDCIAKDDKRILPLKEYDKDIEDNQIKIYVPKGAVSPQIYRVNIEEQMKKLGFEVEISIEIDDTKDSIEEEIKKNNDVFIKESKELLNSDEVKYITLNQNNDFEDFTDITTIPKTEMEFEEFRERNSGKAIIYVEGIVVENEINDSNNNSSVKLIITDGVDSIYLSKRKTKPTDLDFFREIEEGMGVKAKCYAQYDSYFNEVTLSILNIARSEGKIDNNRREDNYEFKRAELHLHTKMSTLDGVNKIEDYVDRAITYGHQAIGVSDHGSVQSFPILEKYVKNKPIKPLYGLELVYVNDEEITITRGEHQGLLSEMTYVIFDIETTGLSLNYDTIIEIAGLKVKNGAILGEFSELVDPEMTISKFTENLTKINNSMLKGKRKLKEVLKDFHDFSKDCVLVAHNADFDVDFLSYNYRELGIDNKINPSIDTLILAKALIPDKSRFDLKSMSRYYKVNLDGHHRAINDTKALFEIFLHLVKQLRKEGFNRFQDLNLVIDYKELYKFPYPKHINLLVREQSGLKNLYMILSEGLTTYYNREAKVLKSYLDKHRHGLLVSSGCFNSSFFAVALNKTRRELVKEAKYYDYLEVQPLSYFRFMETETPNWKNVIQRVIKKIVEVGKELNIPVVATGDVHHLDPSDYKYREIMINTPLVGGGGFHDLYYKELKPNQYFMTTEEMMEEFSFLGTDLAYEIVVKNSQAVAELVSDIQIIPDALYAPTDEFLAEKGIPSIKTKVEHMVNERVYKLYGNPLPAIVKQRVEKELSSIIEHHFSTIYYISHLLVKKSLDDGYLVGSRGSVGSSFVATLMGITEVNPLPPHYVCPKCHFHAFKKTEEERQLHGENDFEKEYHDVFENTDCGWDLPQAECPICNTKLNRDGHDIPFETFLGFKGDKTPDIDLNFSGEYQSEVHEYIRKLFGVNYAFRAGTIGTCATKTSFAMVKDYYTKLNLKRKRQGLDPVTVRHAEIARLAKGIEGSKRSSGQHPGGIVVVPNNKSIFDITPIQYPGDSKDTSWKTTHYEYHSFENNLFKLDVLGHDDPTVIRYLMDLVKESPEDFPFDNPNDIPIDDNDVYRMLSGTEVLGLTSDDIMSDVASYGVPELGTNFVRGMLSESKPKSFADLVKISGLSHGTDVWYGNAQTLVLGKNREFGKVDFKDIIGCRDDIMVHLISYGLIPDLAFEIMEFVRKGKAISNPNKWASYADEMRKYNVPEWYIWSCSKIKYMFPKAHATAYVLMAMRIAWFKLYQPIYFYSAYFSKRAVTFDVDVFYGGETSIIEKLNEIKAKGKEASNREQDLQTVLEVALEMVKRNFNFKPIDLYKSQVKDFVISEDKRSLILPFIVIDSMGEKAARSIVEARKEKDFISKQDIKNRTKLSNVLFEKLEDLGAFDGMIDKNQISIFDF
ncbi:MAG: PolC-type DNA polymerase III [Candidatus Izemoplasmatales bacterium]|nr:PolC-type DNA polymerase III [Candidatus Izemoplasmatales bacterium]